MGPEPALDAALPTEGGGRAEHAEGDARGPERDGVGPDGGGDRGPEGGEDQKRQVIGRTNCPFQRAANVPDGEGVEREVEDVLVEQIRGKEPPGLAPVEDEGRRLGAVGEKAGNRQAGPESARRGQDPTAGNEEHQRHPGNTCDGEHIPRGCWTQRDRVRKQRTRRRFFRPRGHLH